MALVQHFGDPGVNRSLEAKFHKAKPERKSGEPQILSGRKLAGSLVPELKSGLKCSLGALVSGMAPTSDLLEKIEIRPPFFPSFGHLRREAGLCPGLCHGRRRGRQRDMAARGGRGHSRSGAATGDSECSGNGKWEGEKEEEALPMQGYPSRQLKGGARGGLQAFRCGA